MLIRYIPIVLCSLNCIGMLFAYKEYRLMHKYSDDLYNSNVILSNKIDFLRARLKEKEKIIKKKLV